MLPRWGCLVTLLIGLVVGNHGGWQAGDQDGFGGDHDDQDQDDHNAGDNIVIEHRHRPRVHKSYGSGQYVIPAGAHLTQHHDDHGDHHDHHEHFLGDDQHHQGAKETQDNLERGGEVYDSGLEATLDYNEDYSMEDNELYLADGFATISRATQGEDGKYVEKREKAQTHDHYMVGGGDVRFANILGDNLGSDETGKEDKKDETLIESDTAAGPSGRVGKKEGSRTALSKLLRLLIAAYI